MNSAVAPPLAAELAERDRWSREQLLAHQRDALRAVLDHATTASPYYREVLGPDASSRPLHELPTLPKGTFVEQWDRIACDRRLTLAAAEAHAAGPDAAAPYLGRFRVVGTSGSMGLRALFAFGPEEWQAWVALHLRYFMRIGLTPETRLQPLGGPGSTHLTRQLFADISSGRSDTPRVSVVTPLDELVEALNAYQPEALMGYASIWGALAGEQLAGRLHISPRLAMFGGEPTTADIRRRAEDAWGIAPANFYATTEVPIVAVSTTDHPDALEITDDAVVVEVVDERGRPVPPGVPGAKVLLTTLLNRTLPLIRYELSDRVTLAAGRNPAGRPYACLERIEGRTADTLRMAARGGGEVEVLPYRLGEPFCRIPAVRQFQIVWDGARMEVRIVGAADAAERVRAELREALAAAGAVPPPIEVRLVEALEREPGPAAKLKLIKAQLPSARP